MKTPKRPKRNVAFIVVVCTLLLAALLTVVTGKAPLELDEAPALILPGQTSSFNVSQNYDTMVADTLLSLPERDGWEVYSEDYATNGQGFLGATAFKRGPWTVRLWPQANGSTRVELHRDIWPINAR